MQSTYVRKKNWNASSYLAMLLSFIFIYYDMNTLFPLGPGLPFRPSGPLFPFKKFHVLVTVIEQQHPYKQHCLHMC